jgi:hypothetical protein
LGGSVHTVQINKESLVVASKETELEVNAYKSKYMVTSRDQNAGPGHDIKTDSNSFEMLEEFRCLGRTLTNQNPIQEEIKSRLKSENVCYLSVKNLLFSNLLSKNIKLRYTEL